MKLCLVSPVPPPYGGIANWTSLLTGYVGESCPDIELLQINIAPKKRATEGRGLWDRVVVSGADMLKKRKELIEVIKRESPDVIHITTSGQLAVIRDILLLKTAKSLGVPTVYHIRFGRIAEIAQADTREWKLISKAMLLADVVMAIDETTHTAIKKHLPNANVICVPNPVDISKLPKASEARESFCLFLGWVIETKGIAELLEAWEKLCGEFPEVTLKIVGPSSEEYIAELKARYSFEGVELLGELAHPEAMELMSRARLFVLPSYTEGFPNVVAEAMALGAPVVSTNVGAIPDMLSGGCGTVVEAKNAAELEKALREMLSDADLRKASAETARKKLMGSYTAEVVFGIYRSVWDKLSENKRK